MCVTTMFEMARTRTDTYFRQDAKRHTRKMENSMAQRQIESVLVMHRYIEDRNQCFLFAMRNVSEHPK